MAYKELVATIMDAWGKGSISEGKVFFTYGGATYPIREVSLKGILYGKKKYSTLYREKDRYPIASMTVQRTVRSTIVNFVIGHRLP